MTTIRKPVQNYRDQQINKALFKAAKQALAGVLFLVLFSIAGLLWLSQ